jgi:tetratricopeptide (TPR) repeat protein
MTSYPNMDAWLEAFRLAPAQRLDRLFRRGDTISPFQRGEPHDTLLMALRTQGTEDDVATADQALADWLESRLTEPLGVVAQRGWGAYLTSVMEGFALAARMPGEKTGALLRDRFEAFDTWTRSLSNDGPGDLRARFLLALAHNQGGKRRFLGLWYRLCDETGRGALPNLYLAIGLTGLRGLPPDMNGATSVPEGIEGLCRWARHLPDREEARERFLMHWRAFAGRHPRKPETWRELAATALENHVGKPFAAWVRDELGLAEDAPKPTGPVKALHKKDSDSVIGQIVGLSPQALERKIDDFIGMHEHYLFATHNRNDLPRAFNYVGNALLRRKEKHTFALAAKLATVALDHVPNNENNWNLWAQAVEGLGQRDVAESILWRARERFPKSASISTTLAGILATSGRFDEAEALYRETVDRSPDDAFADSALAKLLADNGRLSQAEKLYREARAKFADDPACRLGLGLLLVQRGQAEEAGILLKELEALEATEARTLRNHLEGRVKSHPKITTSPPPPTESVAPEWQAMVKSGRAMWASFLLSSALDRTDLCLMTAERAQELQKMAKELLTEAVRRDPNNLVVRLIAHRHGLAGTAPLDAEQARRVAKRDFALRLELALNDQNEQAFVWLYKDFSEADRRALTAVGWLLHSPYADGSPEADAAAKHLNDWLARDLRSDAASSFGVLHAELRRVLPRAVGTDIDRFLEAWNRIPPATIRDLTDIALLGLVLEETSINLYEMAFAA